MPFTFLDEDKDSKMIDLMVDLWANFATFHNPTPSLGIRAYQVLFFFPHFVMSELILKIEPVSFEFQNTQLMNDATRDQVWPAVKPLDANPNPSRLKNGLVINEKEANFHKRMEFWHENVSKRLFKMT